METYTITADQLKDPRRGVLYPGVDKPGEYHYSEDRNIFYQEREIEPDTDIFYSLRQRRAVEFDDIESGLGIGGVGSDDYNIATEGDTHYHHTHKCGGGQRYDEQCAACGRVTAICNDCELCERCHE